MNTIHLEGMGINGALLALNLEHFGIPFTWHDTNAEKTAWKASTGCIYPSGSTKFGPDQPCWSVWQRWWDEHRFSSAHLERANYFYCTKRPPHEGKTQPLGYSHAGLTLGGLPSFHLNSQLLVTEVRERFERCERVHHGPSTYICTHGFAERNAGAYWGWTRLVELRYDHGFFEQGGYRPCFYFRPNRVQMAYAYPQPGTHWWYAGSSIIKQKPGALRDLEIEPKYERWKKLFTELARGEVEIVNEGDMLSGWRPIATDDKWVVKRGDLITLRPLWNSGIRHFPFQWYQLTKLLGINDPSLEGIA